MWGSVFRLRIHPISNSFLFQPTQYFLSSGSQTPAVCPTPTFTSSQQVFPTWKRTAISSTQHPCPSLKKTSVLRFKGRYTACQLTGPHLQAGKPLFTRWRIHWACRNVITFIFVSRKITWQKISALMGLQV